MLVIIYIQVNLNTNFVFVLTTERSSTVLFWQYSVQICASIF